MEITDLQGNQIRLTNERLAHILEQHPEMETMEWAIVETLESPDARIISQWDPSVMEYYKWFDNTTRGGKFIRVPVKFQNGDAFVLTAHYVRRIPRGE
ncbi:MAG: hypothetical protein ACE5Q6_18760 [Dehalococcoidia bacterium]